MGTKKEHEVPKTNKRQEWQKGSSKWTPKLTKE